MTLNIAKSARIAIYMAFAISTGLSSSLEAQIFRNRLPFRNQTGSWNRANVHQCCPVQPVVFHSPLQCQCMPCHSQHGYPRPYTHLWYQPAQQVVFQYPGQSQYANNVSSTGETTSQDQWNQNDERYRAYTQHQEEDQRYRAYSISQEEDQQTEAGVNFNEQTLDQSLVVFLTKKLSLQNETIQKSLDRVMEHLESPSVKEWANQVKNDHAELADVFRNSGIEQSGSTTSNYNLSMGPYDKLYQICERTSNDQLDQLDSMIGDHSGDEIDMAFLGTHLVTYRALLSELQSTQQSLSENEFKVNLNDVIAKVENLLEQTEQVYKEVRDQKTS